MTDKALKQKLAVAFADAAIAYSSAIEAEQALTAWSKKNTQSELAKKAGVSAQYLNDLVNGKRRLNCATAKRLLEAL